MGHLHEEKADRQLAESERDEGPDEDISPEDMWQQLFPGIRNKGNSRCYVHDCKQIQARCVPKLRVWLCQRHWEMFQEIFRGCL